MRSALLLSSLILGLWIREARGEDTVRMPLADWQRAEERLRVLSAEAGRRREARPVIIGETSYRGRSDGRNLHLTLYLRAELPDEAGEKVVQVVGTDAILVSARRGERSIPLVERGGRWAYLTQDRGPLELTVELIVEPRGPRGSIEYAFSVVESPVTELSAFFPAAGLEPRVSGATRHEVRPVRGGTELAATLGPTREIHLVGFRDVGGARPEGSAKLYGETQSLISLTDERVELFAVVGLTILYAPARRFKIALPEGYELVSADGQGAFQYTLAEQGGQRVLLGETTLGMEHRYEISLRLARALSPRESRVTLPLLRLLEVERDAGYVALEIPGKLSVEALSGPGLVNIDVRELPARLVESSVSPIVRAVRYSGEHGPASLSLARHAEKALAPGGVDALRANTVLTEDGRVMSDLLFTIRNSFQQYLSLELPAGAEVKSAVLDGDPIKPSLDAAGRVLVPLRRSRVGSAGLVPFRVQLVYAEPTPPLSPLGRRELALPRVMAPVASLEWSLFVPSTFETSALVSDVAPQSFVKSAQWHRASGEEVEVATGVDEAELEEEAAVEASDEAAPEGEAPERDGQERASGSMPVRIQLPQDGRQLILNRYWVEAERPIRARFWYARTPLPLVAQLAATVLVASLAFLALWTRGRRVVTASAAGVSLSAGLVFGATSAVTPAAAGLALAWVLRRPPRERRAELASLAARFAEQLLAGARERGRGLLERFEALRARSLVLALALTAGRTLLRLSVLGLAVVLSSVLVWQLARLASLLSRPLSLP